MLSMLNSTASFSRQYLGHVEAQPYVTVLIAEGTLGDRREHSGTRTSFLVLLGSFCCPDLLTL